MRVSGDLKIIDGIVKIFCRDKDGNTSGHEIIICCEYDDPITLNDIAKTYPNVNTVIAEMALEGEVYSYGNHEKGVWEQVGETRGYA